MSEIVLLKCVTDFYDLMTTECFCPATSECEYYQWLINDETGLKNKYPINKDICIKRIFEYYKKQCV